MNRSDIVSKHRAARVTRYHANPDFNMIGQNNADHSFGVAMIIAHFHPSPSANLLMAALHHDLGEYVVGDLPAPFKLDQRNVFIMGYHAEAEARALWEFGVVESIERLTDKERLWLKFADKLEPLLLFLSLKIKAEQVESASDFIVSFNNALSRLAHFETIGRCIEELNPHLEKLGYPKIKTVLKNG